MRKDIFSQISVNIMRNLILSALLIMLSLCLAGAVVDVNNLQESVDAYNSNIDKAPSVLKTLLGDERVNITILLNNSSTVRWGFETKNARIVRSEIGGIENPTIDVFATEDAIYRVQNATDPLAAYKSAEKSGQVRIEGRTLGARLKLEAALSSGEVIKSFFGILS
jgi:hypothetical protein